MIVVVGVNHKTADIEFREKCHFSLAELPTALQSLTRVPGVSEGLILSTCNRVELLADVHETQAGVSSLFDFLADNRHIDRERLKKFSYAHTEQAAVTHLFRVAASLDSLVVGEPQILGQIKEAFRIAMDTGTTGKFLNRSVHRAIHVAKRVRTETGIARLPVSISSIAVELAGKIFEDLSRQVVLLIGAGQMIEDTVECLQRAGVVDILVTNRTYERASQIAQKYQGTTFFFEKLPNHLPRADIVIACTSAPEPLLTRSIVEKAMANRQGRPLFMIDLGVPRNIAADISHIDGAYLYDMDDLKGLAESNMKKRANEMQGAESIISNEVTAFLQHLSTQGPVPVIARINQKADAIAQEELAKTLKKFPDLTVEQSAALHSLTQSIVKKILHDPIQEMKSKQSPESEQKNYFQTIRKLFKV